MSHRRDLFELNNKARHHCINKSLKKVNKVKNMNFYPNFYNKKPEKIDPLRNSLPSNHLKL